MALVEIENLSKWYGENHAVNRLNLTIQRGEFLCVLGPSGCGKTTLLRLITGLEKPDDGTILFDGEMMSQRGFHIPLEK